MIYVVGAFCLDIIVEGDEFFDNTSTPGKIGVRPGGVAFNIYSHIEEEKRLLTAVGNDAFSQIVRSFVASGEDAGRIVLHALDAPPPMYVAFMERGELKVAASQMDAVEMALDAEIILSELDGVVADDILILDANLHPDVMSEVIAALGHRCRIFFEPISTAKAARHVDHLSDLFVLTPDRREFEVLLGAQDPSDEEVFAYLSGRNIRYLLATRGRNGTRLYSTTARLDYPPGRGCARPRLGRIGR